MVLENWLNVASDTGFRPARFPRGSRRRSEEEGGFTNAPDYNPVSAWFSHLGGLETRLIFKAERSCRKLQSSGPQAAGFCSKIQHSTGPGAPLDSRLLLINLRFVSGRIRF